MMRSLVSQMTRHGEVVKNFYHSQPSRGPKNRNIMTSPIGCRCMQSKTGIRINGNVASITQYFFDFCPGDAMLRMLRNSMTAWSSG